MLDLVRDGNTWIKISGANRVSATDLPPYDDVMPMALALIEANSNNIMWGTDWPHPNMKSHMPDDGQLVNILDEIAPTEELKVKLLVENPTRLYWDH